MTPVGQPEHATQNRWLRMQQTHDLWHAERRLRNELEKIPAHGPG